LANLENFPQISLKRSKHQKISGVCADENAASKQDGQIGKMFGMKCSLIFVRSPLESFPKTDKIKL